MQLQDHGGCTLQMALGTARARQGSWSVRRHQPLPPLCIQNQNLTCDRSHQQIFEIILSSLKDMVFSLLLCA